MIGHVSSPREVVTDGQPPLPGPQSSLPIGCSVVGTGVSFFGEKHRDKVPGCQEEMCGTRSAERLKQGAGSGERGRLKTTP
jgi:hypothetical protein